MYNKIIICAILINVPKDIRLKRVKDRSYQKFGDRISPDGDLYEKEKQFPDMVAQRSGQESEDWLKYARCSYGKTLLHPVFL